ncbi:MAG: hypothetical protein Tsb0014_01340 [Pleurocapsa sp.]
MKLIPIIDNREYLIVESNFNILQTSSNLDKYTDFDETIKPGQDARLAFPELIGLEDTCEAILTGEQDFFRLEGISRHQNSDDITYFDFYIKNLEDKLLICLEDVTELMSLKQSLIQRVNEVEITLNKLRRFEYCTNKIVASMGDVLFITTASGAIERVNKSTTKLFGKSKSELLQESINSVIQDDKFNHQEIYNLLLQKPESEQKIEVSFTTQQDNTIEIEFNCFIVPTEIEGFLNCVYIGRDVTARKQAEAQIRRALKQEQELRKLKSGFISMASHEFRNPLSSILICTETIETTDAQLSSQERAFYLQSIREAALNMQSLLEDILLISKAESGKQQFHPLPFDLVNFCQQIIQEIQSIYSDRIINLINEIDLPSLCLDSKVLRYILTNLLSNALKYSPQDTEVDLKIALSPSKKKVIIEVRDRGMGIPQKSQQHLFESFYRASNVGDIPGTGLGLSIVKQSVELHRGTIAINSEVNRGTNIIVTLPIISNN